MKGQPSIAVEMVANAFQGFLLQIDCQQIVGSTNSEPESS